MTMQDLQRIASDERMIPGAPLEDSQTIIINASIDRVWHIQTDVNQWANWYAYLRNAKLVGPFGPGAKLSYGGFPKHNLIIAKVDDPRLVMIYGTYTDFSAVTRWDFHPLSQTQTQVTFFESSVGFILSILFSNNKLGEHLARWLERLKQRADGLVDSESSRPDTTATIDSGHSMNNFPFLELTPTSCWRRPQPSEDAHRWRVEQP